MNQAVRRNGAWSIGREERIKLALRRLRRGAGEERRDALSLGVWFWTEFGWEKREGFQENREGRIWPSSERRGLREREAGPDRFAGVKI